MSASTAPELSVVTVTPDNYETLRTLVDYLRRQTVREKLELVIVAPSMTGLNLDDSALRDFCQFRVVEMGEISSVGRAWAAGVRAASAAVVVFTEDHCYPEPNWAQALIDAHRGPWAAVGPLMGNANPDSMISWANFFVAYGRWAGPAVAGETDDIPPHNSAYKRSMLLEYGDALEAMLEVESLLHQDLRAKGCRLYWQPAAKTFHVHYTRIGPMLRVEFHYGRLFGAARARNYSLFKRLVFTLGAPLIPFVRLRRVLREVYRAGRQCDLLPKILPPAFIELTAAAAGEMFGYAFGAGAAAREKCRQEFHLQTRLGDTPPWSR